MHHQVLRSTDLRALMRMGSKVPASLPSPTSSYPPPSTFSDSDLLLAARGLVRPPKVVGGEGGSQGRAWPQDEGRVRRSAERPGAQGPLALEVSPGREEEKTDGHFPMQG